MASSTYNPGACCNSDCYAFEMNDDEPCWGDVSAVDEIEGDEWYWVHACEGHHDAWDGGKYVPEHANEVVLGLSDTAP